MGQEPKRLDALVVDVEDSTTLLKLYIGRLMKAPSRSVFYGPVVEHTAEIAAAVESLAADQPGRDHLLRIATALCAIAAEFDAQHTATADRLLTIQEAVDLLEAQIDHMLRFEEGGAPEVLDSLARLEAATGGLGPHRTPLAGGSDSSHPQLYEEDPFDEFALSDDFLDSLVDGIDAALDASVVGPEPMIPAALASEPPSAGEGTRSENALPKLDPSTVEPGGVVLSEAEEAALKELFSQIASSYVGPLTDFIGKLRVGPVTTAWIDLCLPAVTSMTRASSSMGYSNIENAVGAFGAILDEVRTTARVVDGDDRARVLAEYAKLADLLPSTFPVVEPNPNAECESIILNSLLKQIRGVGRVTIARLFAAGLVSLEAYYVADPGDLAAAAGLRIGLASTICERFGIYKDVAELASDADIVVRRLDSLVQELRAAQFDFKKATLEEWYTHAPSRAKARARRARQQCMWKINVAIAELGDVEFLNSIKEEIYDKRLERLDVFVRSRLRRATGELAL